MSSCLASGVHVLDGPPVSEDDFGEGILLTKLGAGAGTVTALDFFLGAGVGMRVFGAQNLALSSFSIARRPLPGLPLACRQEQAQHGCVSDNHMGEGQLILSLGLPVMGLRELSSLSTADLQAQDVFVFPVRWEGRRRPGARTGTTTTSRQEKPTCRYGGSADFSEGLTMVFWCRDAIGRLGSGSTIPSTDDLHRRSEILSQLSVT